MIIIDGVDVIIDGVDVIKDKIDNIQCYALDRRGCAGELYLHLWELESERGDLDLDEWVVSAIDRELRDES